MESWLQEKKGRIIFVITEGRGSRREYKGCRYLYRYQSGREIERLFLEQVGFHEKEREIYGSREGKLVGIYSPTGRCGKTAFSIALALLLSQKKSVFYWSLDGICGWPGLFGKNGNELAEVLYYFRQKKSVFDSFSERKKTVDRLDIMPAVKDPLYIREMTEEDVGDLTGELVTACGYEWAVLDIGTEFSCPEKILTRCAYVYIPISSDPISRNKTERFYKLLSDRRQQSGEQWKSLLLPGIRPDRGDEEGMKNLLWGRMGEAARNICKELLHEKSDGDFKEQSAGKAGSAAGFR